MQGYGQYCPVAKATELLADRWTPLIIRDLLYGGCHFNELERGLPGISRSLLVQRLRRLERSGVVERRAALRGRAIEYRLTPAGQELRRFIDALGDWGARWAFGEPREDDLDPALLLWWMRRRLHRDRLPPQRVVIQFDFYGARQGSYWLVIEPRDVSICLQHPGFEIDLLVTADILTFYRVWFGWLALEAALASGRVRIEGLPALARAFPTWLAWSPYGETVRARAAVSGERPAP